MFAVINSKGEFLTTCDTYEDCQVEMETMCDYHPLDDKEIIDLKNLPKHLTDEQKYGVLRYLKAVCSGKHYKENE